MPTYFCSAWTSSKQVFLIFQTTVSHYINVSIVLFLYMAHGTRDDQTLSLLAVNNRLTYSYDFTVTERDGVKYHVTKNAKATVEPSYALYNLTNLFNGDRLLGKVQCRMHSELPTNTTCRYKRHFRHTESYNCNKLHPASGSSS